MIYTPETRCDALKNSLLAATVPSKEAILKRHTISSGAYASGGVKTDTVFPSDYYYVLAVNDAINAVRAGDVGFLYYEYQLKDLVRFVRDVEIHQIDGVYHVFSPEKYAKKHLKHKKTNKNRRNFK